MAGKKTDKIIVPAGTYIVMEEAIKIEDEQIEHEAAFDFYGPADRAILTIKKDGNIVLGDETKLNEASRVFWDHLGQIGVRRLSRAKDLARVLLEKVSEDNKDMVQEIIAILIGDRDD